MIALFTDFGTKDPYVGQLHAVLADAAPGVPVVDLFHHVPSFDIQAAAYLLPAYIQYFAPGTVFVCIVDPGVGTSRKALAIQADGNWFVGPDNGLFEVLLRRSKQFRVHEIEWRPATLSDSFHGRDLFAPVAARLATGQPVALVDTVLDGIGSNWPNELCQLIYIDHYGNGISGVRGNTVPDQATVVLGGRTVPYGRVFAEIGPGVPFWYRNSNNLLEIAVREDSAANALGFREGDKFQILT